MDNFDRRSVILRSVPRMTDWQVPGYDDLQLLGFGSAGEVWAARERSSGTWVALRRLAGRHRDLVAEVRAAATVVRSLPSPHLVRVRTTLRVAGDDVLVLDLADGGPLGPLVSHRGSLTPGEVVTVVAPLAEAVGQGHAHGLRHGRLALSSVLLTGDGMPLLDGLGLTALHDRQDGLDPTGGLGDSADVWALGELCRLLLTGDPAAPAPVTTPLPLRQAVESALQPDPRARPTAGDLAAALLASCPALPLQGTLGRPLVAPPAPSATRGRHRLASRPLMSMVAAGCAVLLVVVAGWTWGSRSAERPGRLSAATGSGVRVTGPSPHLTGTGLPEPARLDRPVDARPVVEALDAARAEAFATADSTALRAVYAPGSPQQRQDAASIVALARLRRTAVGVRHDVRSVQVVGAARDELALDVVEALGAYEVRAVGGAVLARTPASAPVRVRMILRRVAGAWRVRLVGVR